LGGGGVPLSRKRGSWLSEATGTSAKVLMARCRQVLKQGKENGIELTRKGQRT